MTRRIRSQCRGQALVELALVLPLFVMVLFGIIILGIGVFYQQQVTNAAREAARYASVNSGTAICPITSHLDPRPAPIGIDPTPPFRTSTGLAPQSYYPCDTADSGWPNMTAVARSRVFGLNQSALNIGACWSGYVTSSQYDAPPTALAPPGSTTWAQCTIDGQDPTLSPRPCDPLNASDTSCIHCTDTLNSVTVDTASDISEGPGRSVANTVTGYACYLWTPPLAGFLVIPRQVVLHAVITEPIERQQ